MSLGTAIFLSTLILSIVILYGLTRDRWRWGRILIGLCVTATLVVAGIAGLLWYEKQPARPSKLTTLWGIGLGEKESDVLFRKGKPKQVCPFDMGRTLWYWVEGYPKGSWVQVVIQDKPGVVVIAFFGDLAMAEQDQPLRIRNGQSVASTISEWGKPDKMVQGSSNIGRAYHWDRFNLVVGFEKDSADAMVVHDVSFTQGIISGSAKDCRPQ